MYRRLYRKQVALNGHGLPHGFDNGFEGVRPTSSPRVPTSEIDHHRGTDG